MCTGAVNITYEVIRGSLQDLAKVEGALAEPGKDFVSGTGSVILQDGQASVAIPVTILEVKTMAGHEFYSLPINHDIWMIRFYVLSDCSSSFFNTITLICYI